MDGLPLTNLGKKLWRVSRILGNKSPFSAEILAHTEPQIDSILELFAADHPDELTFTRPGKPQPSEESEIKASWTRVLFGNSLMRYLNRAAPMPEALRNRLKGFEKSSKPRFVEHSQKPKKKWVSDKPKNE